MGQLDGRRPAEPERSGPAKLGPEKLGPAGAGAAGDDTAAGDTPGEPVPVVAYAPGVGARIGALNVSALTPLGWILMFAGITGTALVTVSYLGGWVTASLEHFGVPDSESLTLEQATSTPLAWMYRIGTLGLIGSAFGSIFVSRTTRQVLRLAGFATAGLSLLTALIAAVAIAALLNQGVQFVGDADTVEYGWGLHAGFLGIVLLTIFVGCVEYLVGDETGRAPR